LIVDFIIDGPPVGKARPRVTKHGTFTPAKTKNYEEAVQILYQTECNSYMFEGPVGVRVVAYYEIPKSFSKKKRALCLENILYPEKKPDIDNITKIITDALNNIAYKDDKQVIYLSALKLYSEETPFVKVQLFSIGDNLDGI